MERKNQMVTNRINQEYFFYNPAYTSLLMKRTAIISQFKEKSLMDSTVPFGSEELDQEALENLFKELVTFYVEGLPSLSLKVRYHKKRSMPLAFKTKWNAL